MPGFGKLGTGTTGSGEGQLSGVKGVAVNTTGAGGATAGDVYVAEQGNNRVSVFSGSGTFLRMFGRDVAASGPDNNTSGEVQSLKVAATAGTFTLDFEGQITGELAYDAPASGAGSVQEALEALSNIGAGNVTVTGGPGDATGSTPYEVTFGGTLGGVNVGQITINTGTLGISPGAQLSCTGGGSNAASFEYQWLANGVSLGAANGAQTDTYTVQAADAGKAIQCRVSATNEEGLLTAIQTSAPSATQENIIAPLPGTAPPTTTQTAIAEPEVVGTFALREAGRTLRCDPGSWSGSPTFTYQWYRSGTPLVGNGADTSEYVVQGEDAPPATIFQCAVTATNAGGSATLVSRNRETRGGALGNPSHPPTPTATTQAPSSGSTLSNGGGPEVCIASVDTCQAGEATAAPGGLSGVAGIGVDQATGNVFVTSDTNQRVDVFAADGHYEGSIGWGVNASSPEEQVQFCTVATRCQAGTGGSEAGQFESLSNGSTPAVSPFNAHLLVPDPGSNNDEGKRINEFSLVLNGSKEVTGAAFLRAFGADVTPTLDEEQEVALGGATGGSFSLSFEGQATGASGTGSLEAGSNEVSELELSLSKFAPGEELSGPGVPAGDKITAVTFDSLTLSAPVTETTQGAAISSSLSFDASAEALEGALQAISGIGSGNVAVSGGDGGPWTVEFTGALAGTDVASLSGDASNLTGSTPTVEVTTTRTGANGTGEGLESCTMATTCKAGGGYNGSANSEFLFGLGAFPKQTPNSVAIDSSGAIYATGLPPNCAMESCRVQKFNATATDVESFAPAWLQQAENLATKVGSPVSVAVDPANDHIVVTRENGSPGPKLFEFSKSGALLDSSPPGEAGLPGSKLAVGTEERDYLVAGNVVDILGNPPPPIATIQPADEVNRTSATFSGIAKPSEEGVEGGFSTAAYFEYSTDGVKWTSTREVEIGDGTGAGSPASCPTGDPPSCNVSRTVKGLHPGTTYLVRLVVSNGTKTTSSTTSFETEAYGPTVSDMSPNPVGQTTVTISGLVNPNSRPTTYHFEWGANSSYGTRIPAEYDVVAGSGSQAVRVSAQLKGLEPDTTYHFRIVASNSGGTTYGEDAQFTTLNSSGLPDNRGIELVSPPDKRPSGLVGKLELASIQVYWQAAENGEAVGYPIFNATEGSQAGGETIFAAGRSAGGWSSKEVTPPSSVPVPEPGGVLSTNARAGNVRYYSPEDLKCAVVDTPNPVTEDTPPADTALGVYNLYRWNRATGDYTLITNQIPLNPTIKNVANRFFAVAAANRDCTRIFFQSGYHYLTSGDSGMYEWDDGTLREAGTLPNGAVASGPGIGSNVTSANKGLVSPDGRFFFTARSNEGADSGKEAVFVRKSSSETVDATASSSCGGSYEAASPDGSHVFYIGCGERLYSNDVDTGEVTEISTDSNAEDTAGPVVKGLVATSEDGSTVYFAARGQLVAGEGRTYAQNLQGTTFANLYRWRGGEITYVGSVTNAELSGGYREGSPLITSHDWNAQTTKDGRYLLFVSRDNIEGTNPNGVPAAYLYSAESGSTRCVSCPTQEGSAPDAEGGRVLAGSTASAGFGNYTPHSLSQDGRVFFASTEALTPDALEFVYDNANPEVNVYEWHDGQVSLLASGRVEMVDSGGPDGRDVFIRSYEQENTEDTDFAPDLYDFRSGGGFAPKPPPPPPCDAVSGECQGSGSAVPSAQSPASAGFSGAGNQPVPAEAKPKARRHKHKHKKRHKKRRRHAKRHAKKGKRKHMKAKRHAKHNRGGAK